MDKDVLGERAYFHMERSGSYTSDGVEILDSYLQINKVQKRLQQPQKIALLLLIAIFHRFNPKTLDLTGAEWTF